MRPLICNYKLHSIKHVCHTDFSAQTRRPKGKRRDREALSKWGAQKGKENEKEKEKGREVSGCVLERDWQSICTLTTITDFRHFKGFYKLPFALSPNKKVKRCFSDFGNLFWPFLAHPYTHIHTLHYNSTYKDMVTCVFCSTPDCAYHVQL